MDRKELKRKFRERERVFGGWVSLSHPSIAEIMCNASFDFIAIDMEHSTISLEQAQRIIATCDGKGLTCLPRPVSHSNDITKPLLDSGADGMIYPMVNSSDEVSQIVNIVKYPPLGTRSFGVNRAHGYGHSFQSYLSSWNDESVIMLQIESREGVDNLDSILQNKNIDAVMIGPYDLSGSFKYPGKIEHPMVQEAVNRIIAICNNHNISCGTQVSDISSVDLDDYFEKGFSFIIIESDIFLLNNWVSKINTIINTQ